MRLKHSFDICGIVAHSFGAAAVINALAHEGMTLRAVLLAPVLKLRDLLLHTFNRHGLPAVIYEHLVAAYETRFGYSLQRDDPHLRLKDLRAPALVIHDRQDPVIAYQDSAVLCKRFVHLTLHTTYGLGHKRILADPAVMDAVMTFLEDRESEIRRTVHPCGQRSYRLDPLQVKEI